MAGTTGDQISKGMTIPYTNSSGSTIAKGAVVELRDGNAGRIGIALADILDTETGDLDLHGVYELTILTTDVAAAGTVVYWDAGNTRLTTTPSDHTIAGMLWTATANGEVLAKVKIDEGAIVTQGAAVADGVAPTNYAAFAANAITAYAAHAAGAVAVTSNAATDLDTTAAALATLVTEVTDLASDTDAASTALALLEDEVTLINVQLSALLTSLQDAEIIAT